MPPASKKQKRAEPPPPGSAAGAAAGGRQEPGMAPPPQSAARGLQTGVVKEFLQSIQRRDRLVFSARNVLNPGHGSPLYGPSVARSLGHAKHLLSAVRSRVCAVRAHVSDVASYLGMSPERGP